MKEQQMLCKDATMVIEGGDDTKESDNDNEGRGSQPESTCSEEEMSCMGRLDRGDGVDDDLDDSGEIGESSGNEMMRR
jgi:hypothetical protein